MTAWTYEVKVIDTEWVSHSADAPDSATIIEEYLNGMGEMGWELVGFIPAFPSSDLKGRPVNPYVFHAVFKRPKGED